MPKTIYTPRDELVCGKLDEIGELLNTLGRVKRNTESVVPIIERLKDVRHDVERMELKLISRKQEAREWIDVKDTLPALGQKIILLGNGAVQEEIFTLDAEDTSDYSPMEYFWARDDLDECPSVKPGQKWMALPQAPSREE